MTKTTSPQNEGEGNQTEAKRFNEAQAKFAQSGKVPAAAKDAEEAWRDPSARRWKRPRNPRELTQRSEARGQLNQCLRMS